MRDAQPDWIWDAVAELEAKIRTGEVEVPMVVTEDAIAEWRAILG
jgi:basic membrane protein A